MVALKRIGRKISNAVICVLALNAWGVPVSGQETKDARSALREQTESRQAGKPYASPVDPQLDGKYVLGVLRTPENIDFEFVSLAGTMLYLTNRSTGEKFTFVVAPLIERTSKGEDVKLPRNVGKGDNIVIQSFRRDDRAISETQFSSIALGQSEGFVDDQLGGSGARILVHDVLVSNPGTVCTFSTCCVSCGTYQLCGSSVSSSCGDCTSGGGPTAHHRD